MAIKFELTVDGISDIFFIHDYDSFTFFIEIYLNMTLFARHNLGLKRGGIVSFSSIPAYKNIFVYCVIIFLRTKGFKSVYIIF